MMSKKSQFISTLESIQMIFKIFFIGVLMVSFMIVAGRYLGELKKVPNTLPNLVYTERFISSPDCFAVYDVLVERAYPTHIDVDKFNDEQLAYCYNVSDSRLRAFRLTLKYGDNEKTIQTTNWNGLPTSTFSRIVFVNNKKSELYVEVNNE